MADTVLTLFKTRDDAERGVRALLDAGYSEDQVGILGPGEEEHHPYARSLAAGVVGGAAIGGVAGGVLGAAAVGLIPGIGPILAAGALLPVLSATTTSAATGGVAGALIALAGNDDEALYYQQQVEAGSWLVSVATEDRTGVTELLSASGGFGQPAPPA